MSLCNLKITAELIPSYAGDDYILKIDVSPKENRGQPIVQDYPVSIPFIESDTISNFEIIFDMIKMSFLEFIHAQNKDNKFREEFRKNPEGFIARALKLQ
jgi:hypothetical protein